jgi:hypothetical protein
MVVLNEPTWGPHSASRDEVLFSRHLEGAVWHHNYAGYLTDAGYRIARWTCERYQPPQSPRPDIRVTTLLAIRGAAAHDFVDREIQRGGRIGA